MAHAALDAFDQAGNEVIPPLQLDVDAAPALGHQVLVGLQLVLNRHGPEPQDHHHAQENVKCHVLASVELGHSAQVSRRTRSISETACSKGIASPPQALAVS